MLPAGGAGVRDIPKEPRLQAGETKRWEAREVRKAGRWEQESRPRGCEARQGRGKGGGAEHCCPPGCPSPGNQPRGLGLQGLQALLDLQQGLHGAGVGEDRQGLRVLHLVGNRHRKAMGGGLMDSEAPCAPRPELCPALQARAQGLTHLLEEDGELQAELLLELGVPRKERHIHHHLQG